MMPQNNAMHQNGPVTMDACLSGPCADPSPTPAFLLRNEEKPHGPDCHGCEATKITTITVDIGL